MDFLRVEWLIALAALGVGVGGAAFAFIAWRKRKVTKLAPDTFQDMSIFDEEMASGNYEIDPLTEAEVYLAYGNKKQALNLLIKAASDHPERQDIRDKIREIDAKAAPQQRLH